MWRRRHIARRVGLGQRPCACTTYHYRVIATNELGTADGPDETFTTGTSQAAACPNEPLRDGFSGSLPDCRAYELVTPPNKVSAQPDENSILGLSGKYGNLAASEGNRFAYISIEALPGAGSGGNEYLSTRGANGWSPEDVLRDSPTRQIGAPLATHM